MASSWSTFKPASDPSSAGPMPVMDSCGAPTAGGPPCSGGSRCPSEPPGRVAECWAAEILACCSSWLGCRPRPAGSGCPVRAGSSASSCSMAPSKCGGRAAGEQPLPAALPLPLSRPAAGCSQYAAETAGGLGAGSLRGRLDCCTLLGSSGGEAVVAPEGEDVRGTPVVLSPLPLAPAGAAGAARGFLAGRARRVLPVRRPWRRMLRRTRLSRQLRRSPSKLRGEG